MSTFAVYVKRIRGIEPHPDADAIEFVIIDGYRSIARKGQFRPGDVAVYIPESSLLPEWLLKRLGLWDDEKNKGKLSGKEGNRVKAVKIRGALSQGICYPATVATATSWRFATSDGFADLKEGDDAAAVLGITKYEPPIPVSMAGEVFNAGQHLTISFDVENWKSHPTVLKDGEQVIFTEKLHGTCTVVAILPYSDAHPEAFGERKNILVFSKGLGAKGLVFKNNERNKDNLYVRSTRKLIERIDCLQRDDRVGLKEPTFIFGETFGPGVQDLTYGSQVGFRVFALAYGYRGNQIYDDWSYIESDLVTMLEVETVPVLYKGPFSVELMQKFTDGNTTLGADHIREGIVMVPAEERVDPTIGRVCLKSVSANYLFRKNGTEYT